MIFTNRQVLLIKEEATFNVDSVPTPAADAIQCEEPEFIPDFTVLERNFIRPTWGRSPSTNGRKLARVRFRTELKGGGVAGLQSKLGRILTFCSYNEVLTADTSAVYTPSSDPSEHKSATIYLYKGGVLHKMTGCFGTVSFEAAVNGYGVVTCEFLGQYYEPTDVPVPSGVVFEATKPRQVELMQFSVGGFAGVISRLAIDTGIVVLPRLDANGSDGYNGTYIDDRNITGGFDPEATLVADENFWARMSDADELALTARVGTEVGNIVTFDAPKVQYTNMSYASRDRIATLDIALAFNDDAGDDDLTITIT